MNHAVNLISPLFPNVIFAAMFMDNALLRRGTAIRASRDGVAPLLFGVVFLWRIPII